MPLTTTICSTLSLCISPPPYPYPFQLALLPTTIPSHSPTPAYTSPFTAPILPTLTPISTSYPVTFPQHSKPYLMNSLPQSQPTFPLHPFLSYPNFHSWHPWPQTAPYHCTAFPHTATQPFLTFFHLTPTAHPKHPNISLSYPNTLLPQLTPQILCPHSTSYSLPLFNPIPNIPNLTPWHTHPDTHSPAYPNTCPLLQPAQPSCTSHPILPIPQPTYTPITLPQSCPPQHPSLFHSSSNPLPLLPLSSQPLPTISGKPLTLSKFLKKKSVLQEGLEKCRGPS